MAGDAGLLARARAGRGESRHGPAADPAAAAEIEAAGIAFASEDEKLESAYRAAIDLVLASSRPSPAGGRMLIEGADYRGCWLESTGTASAEVLSRFCPSLAESTFLSFALLARDDGLIPYKITEAGPAYRQLQMVTPLARSVWNHSALRGTDAGFLRRMYEAMAANDAWIAARRDSRGSGCVEAFCTFDTGHDGSPRFRGLPDTCFREDPALCDPAFPRLPYLAPDMTANVYCQRLYLARIAGRLGLDGAEWKRKAAASISSLMRECYCEEDGCFYDRDARGELVRIQSDVILRVFACEVGDDRAFASALGRYLLDPRKFFSPYPPTSIAMDEELFDPASDRNSWAGATNLLSLIRAPAAFERHGRLVELGLYMRPTLRALAESGAFPQCLDPWTGAAGYGKAYTPAALCLLDFVERSMGILPEPEGGLRFSACGDAASAYSRVVGDSLFELESDSRGARAYRDGELILEFPAGLAVHTDRGGQPLRVACALPRRVSGTLRAGGRSIPVEAGPNQSFGFDGEALAAENAGGFVSQG